MKNKIKFKVLMGIVVLMFLIFSVGIVSSVGVASTFSTNTPLQMSPGEERDVLLKLQNTDVEGIASVQGVILEGNEIATLDFGVKEIEYQGDTKVLLSVKIPEDTEVGESFDIVYEYMHIGEGGDVEGGTGAFFSQGVRRGFTVKVVDEPNRPAPVKPRPSTEKQETTPTPETVSGGSGNNVWVWILVIGSLVITIVVLVMKKKKKEDVIVANTETN